ncbi:replication initiation protein [Micrococcus luteus]|uniref:replication initiation protein n=1 Tax=Micrococcus luteus TaxID=1270 RepID=UPI0033E763E7
MPSVLLAEEKDAPPKHKPLGSLPRYPYWHPNSHQTTWVLAVDLDHDDALLRIFAAIQSGLPLPSWILERGRNGHAQVGYIVERVATGPTARSHPIRYAAAVRHALTTALAGDPHFTNARMWNPWGWDDQGRVIWGHTAPRSLGQLREALEAAGLWTAEGRRSAVPAPLLPAEAAEGRNSYIFHATRLRLSGTVAEVAHALNASLSAPLSPAELSGIIRSIERWEALHGPPWTRRSGGAMTDDQRAAQAARGRKGGAAGTAAQRAARARGPAAAAVVRSAEAVGRAAQARALREAGHSVQAIQERMGLSRATVYRLLSSP